MAEEESLSTQGNESADRRIIVVAEDDPITAKFLQAILSKAGFEVIPAVGGTDALPKIKTADPQVIIADVLMPDMDGFRLFKEIRNDKKTAGIPFFVISTRKNMAESFLGLGADGFMAKPLQTENFLKQIKALADRPRREPEPEEAANEGPSDKPGEEEDTSRENKEQD